MVVAVLGIATFGAGVRWESTPTRWIGIGVVAVAWFLRFVGGRAPEGGAAESADQPRLPGD